MPIFQPGIVQFWGLVTFWEFFMFPILQTLMWYLIKPGHYGVNIQINFVHLSNFFSSEIEISLGCFTAWDSVGRLWGKLNHYNSELSPSPSVLFTFIKWTCTLFHTDFFLRLLHVLETKAMVMVRSISRQRS